MKMKLVGGVSASVDAIPKESNSNYKSNGSHQLSAKKNNSMISSKRTQSLFHMISGQFFCYNC